MKRLMHILARLLRGKPENENAPAVRFFNLLLSIKEIFYANRFVKKRKWPVVPGNYRVGDPEGSVAVCTLTDTSLMESLSVTGGVAIAGKVYTPNLGIEKIIRNITANPNIRYLLLCGKDSPVFHAGQAIRFLFEFGIDAEKRIAHASGNFPVLRNLSRKNIELFRDQVRLVDCTGENDVALIEKRINEIVDLRTGSYVPSGNGEDVLNGDKNSWEAQFKELKAGGSREKTDYDKNGYIIISVDSHTGEIVVKHYDHNNRPDYLIRGRSGESIMLAVLKQGLVTQLSHASYLGRELAKAEIAIKYNYRYEQDQPLRSKTQ